MEKFSCTVCHKFSSKSSKVVLRHIGSVHSYEPGFSITCGVQGCARVYTNFRSFQKHLQRKHDGTFDNHYSDSISGRLDDDQNEHETNQDLSFYQSGPNEHEGASLKHSAALFLLKTMEVGRVSQVTVQTVIEGVTDLFKAHLKEELVEPFAGLESAYLQKKYFKEEFNMVEPIETRLGQCLRRRKVRGEIKFKLCWDNAYHVPLLSSLKNFLSDPNVLDEVLSGHKRTDGMLSDYCDGEACKAHPLFSADSQALQILLFYDDLEVVNPLGSHTKTHKLAVFYYTLANIRYRSALNKIHLVTLVKSTHVSNYGIDVILQPFMDDLAKLERDEGFDFVIKGNIYNFRGSLALLPADNLASQFIGGYKALNSALRKCRHCMATGESMSHKFHACLFQPRTRSTHNEHCSLLHTEYADNIATTYGLTRDSILNTSRYFHVTEGLPPDCMHDILEGTLQYEIKELLKFITGQRILSLEEINNRIQLFPYGAYDVESKPSPLNLSSDGHSLRQSASQMWCLARLLPLIIGDAIPECEEHWDNFLLLLKIAEYVFSPVSSHEIAAYLTTLIEDYLTTFTELYPNCPIIPKQHYMLHIPEWIVRCGPMTKYWCMRFEAKNSRFKDIANRIKNFKNIAKSLANRHQTWSCYMNTTHALNDLVTGPVTAVVVDELSFASQLCITLSIEKDETIQRCSWVKIHGTKYKAKDIIVLSNELLPTFGRIESIIFTNVDKCYFVCELLHTTSFHPHYNAYEVSLEPSPKIILCMQNELVDYHILCLYRIGNCNYVPLKYFLPQSF